MLIGHKKRVDLKQLLTRCASHFSSLVKDSKKTEGIIEDILSFVTHRAKSVFEEMGFRKEEIEACMHELCIDPHDMQCKISALTEFKALEKASFHNLLEVYKRLKGILEKSALHPFDKTLCHEIAEKRLAEALSSAGSRAKQHKETGQYLKAFETLSTLQPLLADYFDTVKINVEDTKLKNNRLALLQSALKHFSTMLDFSKLQDV
jgi:glycyl-tRNA synthetase